MGRLALDSNPVLLQRLADRFGEVILHPNGQLDRKKLAEIAFATSEGQSDLTAITFPSLYQHAQGHIGKIIARNEVAVFDAALIFEWGVEKDFDLVVTVTAPLHNLIDRATNRLKISRSEAERRLGAQIPPNEKARRANHVIVNDSSLAQLKIQAEELWEKITGGNGRFIFAESTKGVN